MNYNKLTVSTVPSTLTSGVSQAFLMSIGDANSSLIRRQLNLLQSLSRHCPLCIIYLYPKSFNMAGHFVCARLAQWRLMEEPDRSCRRRHEALTSRPHAGLRKYCAFTRKPLPVICNESFYLREKSKWNSCAPAQSPEWAGLVLPGLWPFSAFYGLKEHGQNRNASFGTYVVKLGLVVKEALVSVTYLYSSFIYIPFPPYDKGAIAYCLFMQE